MALAWKNANLDSSSPAYNAATAVFTITETELGYKPDQEYSLHQISTTGLDGGTYSVNILVPGESAFRASGLTGLAETDVAILDSFLTVLAIQIVFLNLGVANAPKVSITSRLRGL